MVQNGQKMVQDDQEMVQDRQEMVQDGQEMFRKCQEKSGNVRKSKHLKGHLAPRVSDVTLLHQGLRGTI